MLSEISAALRTLPSLAAVPLRHVAMEHQIASMV
jgi:hypothetical protein